MVNNNKISSLNSFFAVALLLSGIAFFTYFDETIIKALGIMIIFFSFTFFYYLWKNKKEGENTSYNQDYVSTEKEEDKIRITKKTKNVNLSEIESTTKDSIDDKSDNIASSNDNNSAVKIVSPQKELKFEYGGGDKKTEKKKIEKGKVSASVFDSKTGVYRDIDYSNDVFLNEDNGKIIGSEPRKEFEFFVSQILKTIHALTKTNTAIFAIVSKETKTFYIESFVTTIPEAISDNISYEYANDVISRTIESEKTELLSEIIPSTALDILPFYKKHTGTLSVIAMPVFRWDGLVGVLCLDSSLAGAYTTATIKLLEQFTSLLTAALTSYVNKFELLQAAKTLEAISTFYYYMQDNDAEKIFDGLISTIADTFELNSIGLCLFDELDNQWKLYYIKSAPNETLYTEGCVVNLNESILGKAIINNQIEQYSYLNNKDEIRITKDEPNLEKGIFAAFPIADTNNTYGAFYIIDEGKSNYSDFELGILKTLADHTGKVIEKIRLSNMINNSAIMDSDTRMHNSNAFFHRLEEEIERARDFQSNLVICIFQIDKYSSVDWNNDDILSEVTNTILSNTKEELRIYDLFGKVDVDTYGIVLYDYTRSNAKIWCNNLRNKIANSIIDINNVQVSFTISMGITSLQEKQELNSFVENAQKGLAEAISDGNKVVAY